MATLEVSAVTKSFGATKVLHGVDLHVADGEMIVIVGASGCGKSTLLRIVAGLETATTGSIRIAGREVTALEPSDRDIAMVFQNYALYPHMTVAENMACSTSRCRTSTPSSGCRCGPRSAGCSAGSASPRCSSPMTRPRR